jgi:hypothetical protein
MRSVGPFANERSRIRTWPVRGRQARVQSSTASREQLEELCQYVEDTSPVRDILANPVPVKTELQAICVGRQIGEK